MCCIYALLTGVAFLVYGCDNNTGETSTVGKKCEPEKFKAASEPCYTALDVPADTCSGVVAKMAQCWEKGVAAGGDCWNEEIGKWIGDIVDKKMAGAKKKFKESAEPCLRKAEFEKKCSSRKNDAKARECHKQAEGAAGGEWKEIPFEKGESPYPEDCTECPKSWDSFECPVHWIIQSEEIAQEDHVQWFKDKCMAKPDAR